MIVEHGIKTKDLESLMLDGLHLKTMRLQIKCLKNWGNNCINWCYDYVEDNKYADQKYLDDWPKDYENVKVLSSKYNVAPLNLNDKDILINENKFFIKKNRIIFFHFHGLVLYDKFYSTGFSLYNKKKFLNVI